VTAILPSGTGRVGTAAFVIAYVARAGGPTLSVDRLRTWVSRGYVRRVGRDTSGHAVYDLNDVLRHVEAKGLFENPRKFCHSGRGGVCPETGQAAAPKAVA
jgi:hypothetical protein